MEKESELSFKNFLMKKELEELLELGINETDENKLICIKKVIYLKVNYLGKENKKLKGSKLHFHKKEIEKRYKGTKYERLIVIRHNKNLKKVKYLLCIIPIIVGTFYFYENYQNRKYLYQGVELDKVTAQELLKAKMYLGKLHYKHASIDKAYQDYIEAKELSEILKHTENDVIINKSLAVIIQEKEEFFQREISKLTLDENELLKIEKLLAEAKLFNDYPALGKLYELKGDIFFQARKIYEAKNNYLIAEKFIGKNSRLTEKIEKIEKL
ncbi:hypothetical protein [Fusobacterium sp.]|uniref:hypothetical protein n=1 Tax=Fusobacterium sp. TaxID=68766 RepID=UPI00262765FD|nr:hypothetical protein [Fusobacterium sp.]